MKPFHVLLTKSYTVNINAESEEAAKRLVHFVTGGIQDISDENYRSEYNFSIEEIKCTVNEAFEAEETTG